MATNGNYKCEEDNGDKAEASESHIDTKFNESIDMKQEASTHGNIAEVHDGISDTVEVVMVKSEPAEDPTDIKYDPLAIKQESLDYSSTETKTEPITETRCQSQLAEHVWTPVDHHCDIYQQNNELELVAHRNTRTLDSSNYTCLMCSSSNRKSYSCKRELRQHMQMDHFTVNHEIRTRFHQPDKSYECDTCFKRFRQSSNLTIHKRVHSGEKPYECNICLQRFTQRSNLVKHKRNHSGEKPYECDTCHKRFTNSSNFTRHKRIHSGEKPYECEICQNLFSDRSALVQHKRMHSGEKPYECDLCNKLFSKNSSLVKHKRIHSGEKPYECDTCHQRFRSSSNLSRHRYIHSGEKPYECDSCNKGFSKNSSLVKHKRIHSVEKNLIT